MVRFSRVGLAAVPRCHPSVIRPRKLMRHDGSDSLTSQDHGEGLRALPLNWVECGFFIFIISLCLYCSNSCQQLLRYDIPRSTINPMTWPGCRTQHIQVRHSGLMARLAWKRTQRVALRQIVRTAVWVARTCVRIEFGNRIGRDDMFTNHCAWDIRNMLAHDI